MPPADAGTAVEIDGHVAELAAEPSLPAQEPPVQYDAAAHACADREHHEGAGALPRPEPPLAQRQHVDVIVHVNRQPGLGGQRRRERGTRQLRHVVDVLTDDSTLGVDRARHADADALDDDAERTRGMVRPLDDVEEGGDGGTGSTPARGLLRLGQDVAVTRHKPRCHDSPTQVHADQSRLRHQKFPK